MTNRKEVIHGLECVVCPNIFCGDCSYFICDENDPATGWCNRDAIYKDALELLKAQEPRVMTLEEVIASYSSPIWLETTKENDFAFLVSYDTDHKIVQLNHIIERAIINHYATEYGKTWRCWTSRPTDEQREKVKWND